MTVERNPRYIRDGEPVQAEVPNRPLRTLQRNILSIYDELLASAAGQALLLKQVTVASTTIIGSPVYLHTSNEYRKALAQHSGEFVSGVLRLATSAEVWGIVYYKHSDTIADLLIGGSAALDISNVVDGTVAAGVYYLSGVEEGKLVPGRPPVAVPVLRADGNGRVLMLTNIVDFIDRHVHYGFELTAATAGDHSQPADGEPHTITNANSSLPGWLPANHAVFDSKAPAGAVFGYNLSAHEDLQSAWPPLPLENAYLEWNTDPNNPKLVGVPTGTDGLVVIDRNGIWWMTDCYGQVPWPVNYGSSSSSSSSSASSAGACPTPPFMVKLWFSRLLFATDHSVVTKVRSKTDRIIVTSDNTESGKGAVALDLDLQLVVSENKRGYTALKTFSDNTFESGLVVEGVYTTQPNKVILNSDVQSYVVPNNAASGTLHHGKINVTVVPDASLELDVQLVDVDRVTEEAYEYVRYLGFPSGQTSKYTGKIHIPDTLEIVSPQLTFRFLMVARVAGSAPALTLTAIRVARPSSGGILTLPPPPTEDTVTIDTTKTIAAVNSYYEVESDPYTVVAGDTVFFFLSRSADAYAGEVGVMRHVGVLTSGA